MKKKVTKAIIAAAGYGTRFLPATKNLPKEFLPIVDTPTIHYVVKECIDSGIESIVIIVKEGNTVIEDYFDNNTGLEKHLKKHNKLDRLQSFKDVYNKVSIAYVRQTKDMPYGNGTPLLAAKSFIDPDEAFVYLFADDICDGLTPCTKQLIDVYEERDNIEGVLAGAEVEPEEIVKYGCFSLGDKNILKGLVEKPDSAKVAPSFIASVGRYLLTYKIFDYLTYKSTGKDDEVWVSDAICRMGQEWPIAVHPIEGHWFTTGDPINMLRTTLHFYLENPKYKEKAISIIKEFSNQD